MYLQGRVAKNNIFDRHFLSVFSREQPGIGDDEGSMTEKSIKGPFTKLKDGILGLKNVS